MRLGLSRSRRYYGGRVVIYLCLLGVLTLLYLCACRLQPAFIDCASSYANNMINSVVSKSVTEVFSNDEYSEFSDIKTGEKSSVQTIETDTSKINRLKAQLTESIQQNIQDCQSETVRIPLGNASHFYFLAGLGPKIPIRIYPVSILNTDIEEKFVSAGINQVNHKLYLNVSIEVSFAGLAFTETQALETKVLLTETVIVGDTPEYYGNGNISAALE